MVEKLDDPDIDMNFAMLAARGMLQEIKKNFLLDPEDEAGPFKAGFDVNVKDAAGATAAHHACRAGESKTLKFLVDHGVDLEAASYGGMRAVHHSANCMKENCLRICLEAGAAANSLDDYGSTALHWACARGVLANCSYLIEHGGDCKLGNAAGVTPLHKAAGNGHVSDTYFLGDIIRGSLGHSPYIAIGPHPESEPPPFSHTGFPAPPFFFIPAPLSLVLIHSFPRTGARFISFPSSKSCSMATTSSWRPRTTSKTPLCTPLRKPISSESTTFWSRRAPTRRPAIARA